MQRVILPPQGANPQTFCPPAGRGFTTTVVNGLCIAKAPFNNLSELREIIEASESPKVRVNQLEKRSDGKLIIDLSVEAPKWLPLYTPNGEYYWKLKMPGSITAHNAREISGNDLKWTTTRDNGMFRIHAESQVQ